MPLNLSFSKRVCMQVFNTSVKDLRMFLFSSRLTYMALSKFPLRRYPGYLQKLPLAFLTAAAHV